MWLTRVIGAVMLGCLCYAICTMHDQITDVQEDARYASEAVLQVANLRHKVTAIETDLACERLKNLPQDAAHWHTTLIVQPDWQTRRAEKKAVESLDAEPHLRALKAQTKFHFMTTDHPQYRRDFAAACPLTPCLIITRADGQVIYKESGGQLGERPRQLYGAVHAEMKRHCPDGRCLPPLRFPDQTPDEPPVREPIPDTAVESPAPGQAGLSPPLAVAMAGGVGAVGYVLLTMGEKAKRIRTAARG